MRELAQFFKGFQEGTKEFSTSFTIILNTILLSIVYLLGVGITSFFAKILMKRFLEMKFSEESTYWSDRNLKKKPKNEYYRQF